MRRVRRLATAGLVTVGVLAAVSVFYAVPALAGTGYGLTGSFGSGPCEVTPLEPCEGKFKEPAGVAVNDSPNSPTSPQGEDVYVADKGNDRVEYFSSTGTYVGQFDGEAAPSGALSDPQSVAVDNDASSASKEDVYVTGEIQVAGETRYVIYKFSPTGVHLSQLTETTGGSLFGELRGVAVDPSGNLWVYDKEAQGQGRVSEFSDTGSFVTSFNTTRQTNPGLAVDPNDNVYLVPGSETVSKWDPVTATEIVQFSGSVSGLVIDPATNDLFVDRTSSIVEYGAFGEPNATPIDEPSPRALADNGGRGIAVDASTGTVYVADSVGNAVDVFSVGDRPETPVTEDAKEITVAKAVLHGELNPVVKAEAGWYFAYDRGSECTGGQTTPLEAEADVQADEVSKEITGLEPNTQYTVCVVAENTFGPTFGPAVSFTTPGLPPEVTLGSEARSSVTPFEATLEAQVNPENGATSVYFQYSTSPTTSGQSLATPTDVPAPPGNSIGSGLGDVGVSVPTGRVLAADTTYYYQAVAVNATGTSYGTVEQFTTLTAEKPVVESEGISGVMSTVATLDATINPEYQSTECKFEYGTEPLLKPGTTTTEACSAALGNGGGGVGASAAVIGLEAGRSYYYRVVAKNPTGTTTDPTVQSFTTVPTPLTDTSTPTSGTRARFEGHFTLIPVDTKYSFDYKRGDECTEGNSTPTIEAGSGMGSVAETWEVPSPEDPGVHSSAPPLHPDSEYTVCFVTSNVYGSQVGPPEHFTTPAEPPTVDSESVSGVGAAGATLEAKLNPNVQETTYAFEYSTEGTEGSPGTLAGTIATVNGEGALPAELAELPAGVKTGVLQPRTTYYYRVAATDAALETSYGPVQSFATLGAPAVTTGEAQGITRATATLSGTVNPGGAATIYRFVYIDQAGYDQALAGDAAEKANPYAKGATTTPSKAPAGYATQAVPTVIGGLLPETPYDYALVASNEVGTVTSQNETFTTGAATGPLVSTGAASAVGMNAASISATIETGGLPAVYGFELGTEAGSYGPVTGLGSVGAGLIETVTLSLQNLQPGVTYHYRIEAANVDGVAYGADQSFTTPGFPALFTLPATAPLIATPAIVFPTRTVGSTPPVPKTLTRAQKLAHALKACKKKAEKQRVGCIKKAEKQYGPTTKEKSKKT
jgi:hypothetical protein